MIIKQSNMKLNFKQVIAMRKRLKGLVRSKVIESFELEVVEVKENVLDCSVVMRYNTSNQEKATTL